jgi:hypothetical protein
MKKNGQFPDGFVKIKVTQIHYVTSQTYLQYQTWESNDLQLITYHRS